MVNLSDLSPGMIVKIVDQWNEHSGENLQGEMDKYLGTLMTVKEVNGMVAYMEEDQNDRIKWPECITYGWSWNKHTIDYIVSEIGILPDLSEMI